MKFTVSLEDIGKFGPNVACARAYILKRVHLAGGTVAVTTRELSAEAGISAHIIREAVRSLIAEEELRLRKVAADPDRPCAMYSVYDTKGQWGWPT